MASLFGVPFHKKKTGEVARLLREGAPLSDLKPLLNQRRNHAYGVLTPSERQAVHMARRWRKATWQRRLCAVLGPDWRDELRRRRGVQPIIAGE